LLRFNAGKPYAGKPYEQLGVFLLLALGWLIVGQSSYNLFESRLTLNVRMFTWAFIDTRTSANISHSGREELETQLRRAANLDA